MLYPDEISGCRFDQGYGLGAMAQKTDIVAELAKLNLIERMPFFMAEGRAGRN
ncbi:hypothetical protein QFZ20_002876 [Flavobacterium sp. W4I14]|nr:hypothetical protein [Flavobacterium sp. W4I14]